MSRPFEITMFNSYPENQQNTIWVENYALMFNRKGTPSIEEQPTITAGASEILYHLAYLYIYI